MFTEAKSLNLDIEIKLSSDGYAFISDATGLYIALEDKVAEFKHVNLTVNDVIVGDVLTLATDNGILTINNKTITQAIKSAGLRFNQLTKVHLVR